MKKSLSVVLLLLFTLNLQADDVTGEKVFAKKVKRICGIKGGEVSKKYNAKEWTYIYNSGHLNSTLKEICPGIKPIKHEHLFHLYQFFFKYAKGSNKKPTC